MDTDESTIFKDYYRLKRRYIGLRTKLAIKQAIGTIILSCILLFAPLGSIDVNILTLAPVVYVMITFFISSFTVLYQGMMLIYSGVFSAVYIAILSRIMEYGERMIWVSFVLNFIFTFVMYSYSPGKRWLTIFTCKMSLVNITVVIYFNYGANRYLVLSNLLTVISLVTACILFCSVFIFPWLATRLFSRKIIKTLDTIKMLFQSIGNQIQNRKDPFENDQSDSVDVISNLLEMKPITLNHYSSSGISGSGAKKKKSLPSIINKFNKEIKRLNILLNDCRVERWNSTLTSHYESLLAQLIVFQKQLLSMKSSIDEGFSKESRKNIIEPMLPVVESLVQQVSIQITISIEILLNEEEVNEMESIAHNNNNIDENDDESPLIDISQYSSDINGRPSIQFKVQLAKKSFKTTIELIDKAKEFYKTLIVDKVSTNFEEESRKINYFFTGIYEFSQSQKSVLKLVLDIKKNTRRESVIMELIKYGLWSFIRAFPYYLKKRFSRVLQKGQFKDYKSWDFKEYFRNTFLVNGRWQYPLQVSVGFVGSTILYYYIDLMSHNEFVVHGLWAVITTIIVFQPSLGSTLTRSIHRTIGTVIGGFSGFLVSWLSTLPNWTPAQPIILLIGTFICVIICSHVQQDPRYSYAGSVGALTFILISYSQYFSGNHTFMYAVLRLFFVIAGIIMVLIVSLLFFPFFTYKDTRVKIYKNLSSVIQTFCLIIETNLPLSKNGANDYNSTRMNIVDSDSISSDHGDANRGGVISNNSYGNTQRKGIKIGKNRGTLEKSQKDINNSIKSIRQLNGAINGSLLDIKSEFFFKPAKYSKYVDIHSELTELHTYLVSSDTILSYPYREKVLVELQPTFIPIQELIEELKNFSQQFTILTKPNCSSQSVTDLINSPDNLLIHMKSIYSKISKIRVSLIERDELQKTYPDFVQFEASIFNCNNFITTLIKLMESLQHIKN